MSHVPSYEFCAFSYLDWWLEEESALHDAISSDPTELPIRRALQYFGVTRTFTGINDPSKVALISQSLREVCAPESTQTNEQKVVALAKKFQESFKFNLSAASKLLWLTCKATLIVDSRAERALGKHFNHSFNNYEEYCKAWREEYEKAEGAIRAACQQLPEARLFMRSCSLTDEQLLDRASETWFTERVFDVFLWEIGAKEVAAETGPGAPPSAQFHRA